MTDFKSWLLHMLDITNELEWYLEANDSKLILYVLRIRQTFEVFACFLCDIS